MPEVEIGDEKAVPSKKGGKWGDIKRFRGKEGKTERIYLVEDKAVAEWTHYFIRGYFKCLAERTVSEDTVSVNKSTCPMCVRVEQLYSQDPKFWKGALAKLRIGTNVIYYNTDKEGDVLDPFTVENRLWVIDQQKFSILGKTKKRYGPLQGYDLLIDTQDAQFQKLSIMAAREAICRRDTQLWERTLQEYEAHRYDVAKTLSRTLNVAEMEDAIEDLESQLSDVKEKADAQTEEAGISKPKLASAVIPEGPRPAAAPALRPVPSAAAAPAASKEKAAETLRAPAPLGTVSKSANLDTFLGSV